MPFERSSKHRQKLKELEADEVKQDQFILVTDFCRGCREYRKLAIRIGGITKSTVLKTCLECGFVLEGHIKWR